MTKDGYFTGKKVPRKVEVVSRRGPLKAGGGPPGSPALSPRLRSTLNLRWGNLGRSGDSGDKVKHISDAAMQLPTLLFMNVNGANEIGRAHV